MSQRQDLTDAHVQVIYNRAWWLLIFGFIFAFLGLWVCIPLFIFSFLLTRLAVVGEWILRTK
jgi:flagellar biosynthesis component FlhA